MTNPKTIICSVLVIGALFFCKPAHAAECEPDGTLSYEAAKSAISVGLLTVGFSPDFGGNKVTATVTNQTSCRVPVSLGTFKMFGEWSAATQSQQQFFSDTSVQTIGPGSTATFTASTPSCAYQYDVWYGPAPHALIDNQVYGSFLAGNPAGNTPYCTNVPAEQPPTGWLDAADCTIIGGWSFDQDHSADSIDVRIYDGTTAIATVRTDGDRWDVRDVMKVTGNHGFTIPTPASLKDGRDHVIHAFGMNQGNNAETELLGSPKTLRCDVPPTTTPPTTTPPATTTPPIIIPPTPTTTPPIVITTPPVVITTPPVVITTPSVSTTTIQTSVTNSNSTTTINLSTTTITNNYVNNTTSSPAPIYYPTPQIVYAPPTTTYVPTPVYVQQTTPAPAPAPIIYTPPAQPAPVIYPGPPNTGFGPKGGPLNVMLLALPLVAVILAGAFWMPFAKHESA